MAAHLNSRSIVVGAVLPTIVTWSTVVTDSRHVAQALEYLTLRIDLIPCYRSMLTGYFKDRLPPLQL